MNRVAQGNPLNISADKMYKITNKSDATKALMLLLALDEKNQVVDVPAIIVNLIQRGLKVDSEEIYDTLDELAELGLGSLIYSTNGRGVDKFKKDYNLTMYASRAFPTHVLDQWRSKVSGKAAEKFTELKNIKLAPPKRKKPGRPPEYSLRLKRYFTPEEFAKFKAEREAKKKNKRPRGRPKGSGVRHPEFVDAPPVLSLVPSTAPELSLAPAPTRSLDGLQCIPLGRHREFLMKIPQDFNQNDLALVTMLLEHYAKNG